MTLTSTQFVRIEARTDCAECSQSLPLNGPLERLSCAFCGAPVSIPDSDLAELMSNVQEYFDAEPYDEDDEFAPSAEEEERARTQTVLGVGCDLRYSFALGDPVCSSCGAVLPLAEPEGDADSELVCRCGCLHVVEPGSDALTEALECEVQIISDNAAATAGDVGSLPTGCPQCGAELSIDRDSRRVCECEHCGSQVFLPDKVWLSLHPPPQITPWYVRFLA